MGFFFFSFFEKKLTKLRKFAPNFILFKKKEKRGVSHCGLAIHILKVCDGKRRRIMETQIFHHSKNIIFQKFLLKETKILQDFYYNSVTKFNSSFNTSQNIIIFQKCSFKNRPIRYLLFIRCRGQNPLSYYTPNCLPAWLLCLVVPPLPP